MFSLSVMGAKRVVFFMCFKRWLQVWLKYPVVFVCICEREDTPLPVFPGLLNT